MKLRIRYFALALTWLLSVFLLTAQATAIISTNTKLAITSSDPLITVSSGTVVTLTATVKSKLGPVTAGQVRFCDGNSSYCTDIHLLRTSQLTSNGTATLKFIPGIGKHSYYAHFNGDPFGTPSYEVSESNKVKVSVTGKFPTAASITASGGPGDYTLTATVTGFANSAAQASPAGKVSFLDTSNNNHVLGKATLGAATSALNFFNSSTPSTDPYPQSAAVADFNGDGKLDLAIPVYSIFTSLSDVDIFLGNGDGTFTRAPAVPVTGQNANNAAVGDFNGDGKPDIALSLPDANQVQVLLGNGDGTFTPMPPITVNAVFVVAAGEFNGDGIADLVAVCPGAGAVVTLLGNGDGTFRAGTTIPVVGGAVAVADFNGDGNADLAVVNFSDTLTIFLGDGFDSFTQINVQPSTGVEPLTAAVADFNGDGIPDLAVSNQNYGYPNPGTLTILLGNGDGTFNQTAQTPQTGSIPDSVQVADFNGDGKADLVTGNAGGNDATVLLGNGDGTFAAPFNPPAGTNSLSAAVGDFNGDGVPDIAAADNYPNFTVTVLLTEPTRTATATATGIAPKGSGQHLVDANYKGNATYQGSTSPTTPLTGSDAFQPQ